MAQMAPALAEAAGSPSPNADLASSTVQSPLGSSKVRERVKNDDSRPHINSASLNHNGICRSLTNSKTNNTTDGTVTVSRVMDKVHRLNKFPFSRRKSLELAVSERSNTQNYSPLSHVEKTNDSDKIHSLSSQKETLVSTPTRIPITTTKTCGLNLLPNLSSCEASVDETNEEMKERHSVAQLELSLQALFDQKVAKIGCNQTRLVSRARKLERRLRTLQTRQLESHVGEQLASFSVHRRKSRARRPDQSCGKVDSKSKPTFRQPTDVIVKEEISGEKRPIRSLVRVEYERELSSVGRLSEDKNKSTGLVEATGLGVDCSNSSDVSENDVARSLVCQLELVEEVADSDATLSSSGGESCDEMDEYDAPNTELKRSSNYVSQFYAHRGKVASRWTWLRSQVIDIERRIRRCEETYKTIRVRKKPIQLERPEHLLERQAAVSVANKSADDLLVDTVNTLNNVKETHAFKNSIRSSLQKPDVFIPKDPKSFLADGLPKENAKSIVNNGKSNLQLSNEHVNACTAARTRPLQSWQKRKLFSLPQLQKPSPNVLCYCSSPMTPCILCQKSLPSLPQLKSNQDVRERVSLVDLSFHPVLSFKSEIPLSLHFGALLKKGNFQSKICKLSPPKTMKVPTKRKYVRSASSPAAIKKERKDSLNLSSKKQSMRGLRNRKKPVSLPNTPKDGRSLKPRLCKSEVANKKRPAAVNAGIKLASQLQKRARSLSLPSANSRPTSPVSSTASPTSLGHSFPGNSLSAKRKKPTSNAFDINNIVIPYSMASTTRVEKLQYKEILTPAWRELVVSPEAETSTAVKVEEDEIEDLSNLTFALRHMKCEEQERKRFLGMAIKKKKRAARQSSEATTPEPVSPGSFLHDGTLSVAHISSGAPSPNSSNPPSLNSSLNVTSPTGLTGALPVVNMLPQDGILAKLDRSAKSSKHGSRRSSFLDQSEKEDSNDALLVVAPWPLRSFPLSEKEQEDLKNTHSPPPPSSVPASPSSSTSHTNSPILSPVDSPDSAGDTNWTVKVLSTDNADSVESDSKPPRKGIVLKLAKR